MGVCTHVGVQSECHAGCFPLGCGQFVDDVQLRYALHVEAEDVLVESEIDFPVALAHSGIDNLAGRKASPDDSFYFAATDTVGSQTSLSDQAQ